MSTSAVSIHPETNIGYVHLIVPNMERSLAFYQGVLGFHLHRREGDTAYLGAGDQDLLLLTERPDAPHRGRRTTGLYHFAILVPSRADLARQLAHMVEMGYPLGGASDHLVSEALYLSDPDGNGIEIYRDRPRDAWPRQQGRVTMGLEPLDVDKLLAEGQKSDHPWEGLAPGTIIGHMHLQVADIAQAEAFYHDVLGFDIIMSDASALFVSAGGYHHHLGLNTWASRGASPPALGALGLHTFVVRLPHKAELARVISRLQEKGIPFEETSDGVLVRDPSHNSVLFITSDAA